MKINFTQPLHGLDGKPLMDETGKPVLLSTPCINALLATPQSESIEPVEKLARWVLAQKITQAQESIEVTIEDVAKIKELTGKYMPILVMGSVWQLLENNDPK